MGRRIRQDSAGGVVVDGDRRAPAILLIKPQGRNRWQLPKGTIDAGEGAAEAAVREVREEGGVDATVIAPLAPITFFYQMHGRRFLKQVEFFLMQYRSGSPTEHDSEVDDAQWYPLPEALERLTFESEREVVREAMARLAGAPAPVAS